MQIQLVRFDQSEKGTTGILRFKGLRLFTIERPWLENFNSISCIPCGTYPVGITKVDARDRIRLEGVPQRTLINIEVANDPSELAGCIGLGTGLSIRKNGTIQTVDSAIAYRALLKAFHALGPSVPHTIQIQDWA